MTTITSANIDALNDVSSEVLDECLEQLEKWGQQDHDHSYSEPKRVEFATAADRYKQINDARGENITWDGILLEEVYEALAEGDFLEARRAELVQVAAVAISEIASIDRKSEGAFVSVESDLGDLLGEDGLEDDE